ncbi:MAG: zinc-binding dehydrogenase [Balneolaceae bacterium]
MIHAGASGVGTAAIQLAKHLFNARVITTASHNKKLNTCKNLGADICINYKKEDFSKIIKKQAGDNSVDLIIDFIGAPYWEQNIDVLALDGRIVCLSMLGGVELKNMNLLPILRKRLKIMGSTLRNRPDEYKMRLTSDFHTYAMELFETEHIKPVIDTIVNWKDVEEVHKRMEKNKNIGKIVMNGM